MQRVDWRARTYARAAEDPGGQDPGGGGGGGRGRGGGGRGRGYGREQGVEGGDRVAMIAEANRQGKMLADKRQAFQQMKWDCNSNRTNLGEGNIYTFLVNEGNAANSVFERSDVNKMLRVGGFTTSDVLGITKNDFRPNQIEVSFDNHVEINILELEDRIKNHGVDVSISKFDKIEEFLTIYGLPLSSNMAYVKEQIFDSIKAFVKEVVEVIPLKHGNEIGDDFFTGKFNGIWRVKVVPRVERQIPNYIVVGQKERVMGKAVYSKAAGNKLEMCADCFSTGHYKRSAGCEGPIKWEAYCKSFEEDWHLQFKEREQQMLLEQQQVGQARATRLVGEVSRVLELEKRLVEKIAEVENEKEVNSVSHQGLQKKLDDLTAINIDKDAEINELKSKLENKVIGDEKSGTQEEVYKNLEDMSANVEYLEANCEDLKKKLSTTERVNEDLKANIEELEGLLKENEDLVKKASEEQNLFEKSLERMHLASNVTTRPKTPVQMEPFEESAKEGFELGDKGESSPDFHGFSVTDVGGGSDGGGPSKTEQLSQKIEDLEDSSLVSISNNSEEVPVIPKRKERDEDSSSPNNSKIKKSEKHPDVGSKIVIDTLKGKGEYVVKSKKSKRPDDYIYVLVNSKKKSASFDMKDRIWAYLDEVDPLKSPQKESEPPSKE